MPFVKIDTAIVRSSLYPERDLRTVFLTALFMAEPVELEEATRTLKVRELTDDKFVVPKGWYGIVRSSGLGIIRADGISKEKGLRALEQLAAPDPESRSADFDGRRMVRIDGGYVILNYMKYRERDYTSTLRKKLQRLRDKEGSRRDTVNGHGVTANVTVTQAEADAEADAEGGIPPNPLPDCPAVAWPEGLGESKAFTRAWRDFVRHRKEIGAPLRQTGAERALAKCKAWGAEAAVAALHESIASGWRGVFPVKGGPRVGQGGQNALEGSRAAVARAVAKSKGSQSDAR